MAHHGGKAGREVALIPKADLVRDLADGEIRQHQQLLGACDPRGQQKIVGRRAHVLAAQPQEQLLLLRLQMGHLSHLALESTTVL